MAESRSPDDAQGQKSVTIRDVAKQAGVSVATVSRVLNGSPKVDPGIAERVHTVAAQLNHQPSKVARMLAGQGSTLLGLLVTDMQNPFYLDLIRGVEEVAQQHNYLVIVCNTMENTQKEENYLKVLSAEPIAGVIVVPTRGQIAGIEYLRDRNIPLVAVDRRVEDQSIDCVIIDNRAAAREAVTHLITNGYRRIGVIGGPKTVTNANERILGYRQALQQAGIVREAALEQRGVLVGDNVGIALANRLLDLDPPVEAIFAANNRLTIGAMRAIHAHQMRIPEDIALVGFDDIQWAVPEQVSVTTVIQSAYELGSAAANRLIQRLQKPDAPRQEIVLQHQLAVGTSSAPHAAKETFPRSISARVEKNKKKAPRRVISQETFSD